MIYNNCTYIYIISVSIHFMYLLGLFIAPFAQVWKPKYRGKGQEKLVLRSNSCHSGHNTCHITLVVMEGFQQQKAKCRWTGGSL